MVFKRERVVVERQKKEELGHFWTFLSLLVIVTLVAVILEEQTSLHGGRECESLQRVRSGWINWITFGNERKQWKNVTDYDDGAKPSFKSGRGKITQDNKGLIFVIGMLALGSVIVAAKITHSFNDYERSVLRPLKKKFLELLGDRNDMNLLFKNLHDDYETASEKIKELKLELDSVKEKAEYRRKNELRVKVRYMKNAKKKQKRIEEKCSGIKQMLVKRIDSSKIMVDKLDDLDLSLKHSKETNLYLSLNNDQLKQRIKSLEDDINACAEFLQDEGREGRKVKKWILERRTLHTEMTKLKARINCYELNEQTKKSNKGTQANAPFEILNKVETGKEKRWNRFVSTIRIKGKKSNKPKKSETNVEPLLLAEFTKCTYAQQNTGKLEETGSPKCKKVDVIAGANLEKNVFSKNVKKSTLFKCGANFLKLFKKDKDGKVKKSVMNSVVNEPYSGIGPGGDFCMKNELGSSSDKKVGLQIGHFANG